MAQLIMNITNLLRAMMKLRMVASPNELAAWHEGNPCAPPRYPLTMWINCDNGLSGLDGRSLPTRGRRWLAHSWSQITMVRIIAKA